MEFLSIGLHGFVYSSLNPFAAAFKRLFDYFVLKVQSFTQNFQMKTLIKGEIKNS